MLYHFATREELVEAAGITKSGFFYHFLDIRTGERVERVELSSVDTTILLMGVLFAGQFYDSDDFAERLKGVDLVAQTQDNREHDILERLGDEGHRSTTSANLAVVLCELGDMEEAETGSPEPVKVDPHDHPHVKVHTKASDQAHICLGVHSYPLDHPDRYVLQVLSTVLGGGMSSRLFTEVREYFALAEQVRVYMVIERHIGLIEEFLDSLPADVTLDGQERNCLAALARAPLASVSRCRGWITAPRTSISRRPSRCARSKQPRRRRESDVAEAPGSPGSQPCSTSHCRPHPGPRPRRAIARR